MVKKRQKKRVVIKKKKSKVSSSPSKISKSKSSISRKDFETFKFGVVRLNELKKELDSLDTRGFSKEEQAIRNKLKNVSEIPNIEKSIKILKSKIHKKYRPKKRKSIVKKDIHDIKEDIPELRGEIRKLGRKVEESTKRKKENIDPRIGASIDNDFNDFLNNLKVSVSERVKTKEKEIGSLLKVDLQKREAKFREKYLNLIREFNEKKKKLEKRLNERYTTKVKTTLQKEISEKFDEKLKKKLDDEKVALGKVYIASLKKHSQKELEKQKQKLNERLKNEFSGKIKSIENQFKEKGLEEERLCFDKKDIKSAVEWLKIELRKIAVLGTREYEQLIDKAFEDVTVIKRGK